MGTDTEFGVAYFEGCMMRLLNLAFCSDIITRFDVHNPAARR